MSPIIYVKNARILIVNLSHLQHTNNIFFDGYITLKDICQGFVYINSSPKSAANMRRWTGSTLIHVMAYGQLDP